MTDDNLYIASVDQSAGQLGAPTLSGGMACNSLGTIPSIAVAPSNTFVFVIDKCFSGIHVYQMHGPGVSLTEIPGSPYNTSDALDSIVTDGSGKFLYALGVSSTDAIYQFAVNASTGELALNSTTTANGDFRQILVDPQGKFVFASDLTGGKIWVYSMGGDGSLSGISGSPFTVPAGGLPVNMVITNDGKFLYVPLIPSGIAAFAVDPLTGALSDVTGSPFTTTNQPFSLAIGPGGKFIYTIDGSANNEIDGFAIDTSGVLTPIVGTPLSMASSLSSLVVDPAGKFLYSSVRATSLPQSMILGLAIDPASGALSALPTSPYSAPQFPVDLVSLNVP